MYYWWYIIYRHHFCLNLTFFYFLYSLTLLFFWHMWFLLYDSDSMSLRRYHFLPIFQSLLSHWGQCSAWLGGELRKEVLLLMLSYFGNLVVFFLILKFFKFFILLSMVIKEKFLKNEMGEIEFLSFTWLRVCIMLIKVDELLKLLLNLSLVLPL